MGMMSNRSALVARALLAAEDPDNAKCAHLLRELSMAVEESCDAEIFLTTSADRRMVKREHVVIGWRGGRVEGALTQSRYFDSEGRPTHRPVGPLLRYT